MDKFEPHDVQAAPFALPSPDSLSDVQATSDVDQFGSEMLADPYPVYHRLRSTAPVHRHERLDAWVMTRYKDVLAGLHDQRRSSDPQGRCGSLPTTWI
jgi:cytochrome P450